MKSNSQENSENRERQRLNGQNHWDFGPCPLFGILKTRKHFGKWICVRPQVRGSGHLLCWVPQKELTSVTDETLQLMKCC
jgi:hypothetical protein